MERYRLKAQSTIEFKAIYLQSNEINGENPDIVGMKKTMYVSPDLCFISIDENNGPEQLR